MSMHHHRAGVLKQQNKAHKHGRHKSKGLLEKLNKGRVNIIKLHKKRKQDLSREERRNQASQIRERKRFEFLQKRRGICEAPFLVGIIPLNSSINPADTLHSLKEADSENMVFETREGHVHICLPRLKHRFTVVVNNGENLYDILDLLKVANTIIFVTTTKGVDDNGKLILTAALAQGLPTSLVLCGDIQNIPQKRVQECKLEIQKELERWLPGEKIHGFEKNGDGLMILRRIANQKQKGILQRDRRPHLLAENVEFIETSQGKGTLKVTGYLRGQPLSVNYLLHIPGWGDFKMSQISAPPDPFSEMGTEEVKVLAVPDPHKQESLESENVPDPMDAEQTWPTEDDMLPEKGTTRKRVKKVPRGMSDYQAAWIPDDDAFELDNTDDEEGYEDKMEAESDGSSDIDAREEGDMDAESVVTEGTHPTEKYDKEVDMEEEKESLRKIREAADEDKQFPDEMDTPSDIPARERFIKYRGLASFRSSPWDPKENLPYNYARIFQFQNFERTKRQALKEQEECEGAMAGWFITVDIVDVPTYMYHNRGDQPIVIYGLLKHEQKMSVVNMGLQRCLTLAYDAPIKSKDTLLFQCGYRRFRAQPIFSQHTKGNKFKYERFFQTDDTIVATVFAPIIYPPCSVLVFKENSDGTSSLVASGSVLSVDPNRVIVKRVVLTGHPFKVNKRSAVIRFMFFNREDIEWFKPIELHTKYGRRGHIKEPLGTHGHMKCVFNGQLKSQDTIMLKLYKRIFPKWTYDPKVIFTGVDDRSMIENTMND